MILNRDKNVWDAALERIAYLFAEFDNIVVAFSGGKDSGVLLNLVMRYAEMTGDTRKIGLFMVDHEAICSRTSDYVDSTYEQFASRINNLRCCVQVCLASSTTASTNQWICWDAEREPDWIRPMPAHCLTDDAFPWFQVGMSYRVFRERFISWYHDKVQAGRTAVLIGIRAQESLDRWRAIKARPAHTKYNGVDWTREQANNMYVAYPIYDWRTEDVWIANGRQGWACNTVYDEFHRAGVPLEKQRVAILLNVHAADQLRLCKRIDQHTWERLLNRADGVNGFALYGNLTATEQPPDGHTWDSYLRFLLDTLPPGVAQNYRKRLKGSSARLLCTAILRNDHNNRVQTRRKNNNIKSKYKNL